MKAERYLVRGRDEEGPCRWCGYELASGEAAFKIGGRAGYCSRRCAESAHARAAERAATEVRRGRGTA